MYQVEIYGRIRRAVLVEGRSQRAVAREFGVARTTVRKMLGYSIPPGYRRKEPAKRPRLGPWVGVIDAILEEDKTKPAKQRHTAKRIFDRLRTEHAFPIERASEAAPTGAVGRRDRRHSGRRQDQTSQAAAHRQADLRPFADGARVPRRKSQRSGPDWGRG